MSDFTPYDAYTMRECIERQDATMARLKAENAALREEVERLRMQLAACGVAAMCNTKEATEKQRIGKDSPYYSASYQDVCDAVDREMALRTRLEQAEGKVEKAREAMKSSSSTYSVFDKLRQILK